MRNVVAMKWLLARLYEENQVIVDCRFQLGKPNAGREAYEAAHIPGAVYLDLERDLSGPVGEHGGRHPLPDISELADKLGALGIDSSVRVVAYDDQGGAMASRLWWLLRYMGHENVAVMDQGFTAWKDAGFPVTDAAPAVPIPKTFVPKLQDGMLADVEDVRRAVHGGAAVLIDSREGPRYRGEVEPLDRVAGHIPGARNRFWKEALAADGAWKNAEEQRARFADLQQDDRIIVYCGSGVTACPNVLALEEAGFRNVRLYAGSWSDWISYEGNAVADGGHMSNICSSMLILNTEQGNLVATALYLSMFRVNKGLQIYSESTYKSGSYQTFARCLSNALYVQTTSGMPTLGCRSRPLF